MKKSKTNKSNPKTNKEKSDERPAISAEHAALCADPANWGWPWND